MFRELNMADVPTLAALDASLPEGELQRSEDEFRTFLDQPTALGYGVEENGRVLAYVLFLYAADSADLCHIVTRSWARGKGYGRQLLQAALQALATRGIREVFLEVQVGNIAAESLYSSLGAVQVGTRPGYYVLADGTKADARVMLLAPQQA
jgi:ribosomal protein S18 acetylase RimI-like enzyme